MGRLYTILWILGLLGIVAFAGAAVGAVDWVDEILDRINDVTDEEDNETSERPDIDIVAVRIAEEGDDINVTMELAGPYNASGVYMIFIDADDGNSYTSMRMRFTDFSVYGPTGGPVSHVGMVSVDETVLSWKVAKANIAATVSLEISFATTDLTVGMMDYEDFAGFGSAGLDFMPKAISMVVRFEKLTIMRMEATTSFDGENGTKFREVLDDDEDGTVTSAEVSKFVDELNDNIGDDDIDANISLDGNNATKIEMEYSIEGAEGPVDSTGEIRMVMEERIHFPEPPEADTHTYDFGDDDDGFIGGDEPWEPELDVTFKVVAPTGWRFNSAGWPGNLASFLSKDKTKIEMDSDEVHASWGTTIGSLNGFVVEKKGGGGGDDGSPGFGLLVTVIAATGAALMAGRRKP